uniref:Peptidase S1 domain-containing protein n=1 Tax=Clastoptera arizonana TaxID=38151 RepID=A0A1B6CC77_9HEMI
MLFVTHIMTSLGFWLQFILSFYLLGSTQCKRIQLQSRIIGGQYVDSKYKYPYMALIKRYYKENNDKRQSTCTGTIVNPSFVLTSAHCLRPEGCTNCTYNKNTFSVYTGTTKNDKKGDGRKSQVERFHIHPEFERNDTVNKCRNNNDIALVELTEPLVLNRATKVVKLPTAVDYCQLSSSMTTMSTINGDRCTILGWGRTDTHNLIKNTELKLGRVALIDKEQCSALRNNLCQDTELCTVDPDKETGWCKGDSGGPVMCNGVQYGVISFGRKDCEKFKIPQVSQRVDIHINWINDIIAEHRRKSKNN